MKSRHFYVPLFTLIALNILYQGLLLLSDQSHLALTHLAEDPASFPHQKKIRTLFSL